MVPLILVTLVSALTITAAWYTQTHPKRIMYLGDRTTAARVKIQQAQKLLEEAEDTLWT